MEYSIKEVTELAGVSARTLRYYDEIGLLKPSYVNEAGYRYYGERELELLQQILFYRERKFDLKSIQQIIYQKDFDVMNALNEHLLELEEQRKHMDSLIQTVKQTIQAMKGECEMSNKEKFAAFKENMIKENEEKYGKEIREKYGDEKIDESNRKMLKMSEEEWEEFQALGAEIMERLQSAVKEGTNPESEVGKVVADLHKRWLMKTWKQYSPEAHKGLAQMYLADERFRAYYDKEAAGCTEFLTAAISFWAGK